MLAAFFLTVLKDRTGRVCQTVSNVQDECVKLYQTYRTSVSNCIKLSASSGLAPSPVLDLDQFCQVGEQARLNSNSIVMMLVFLLTVLRVEEAGQCITEFSGTGHRIECITELFGIPNVFSSILLFH